MITLGAFEGDSPVDVPNGGDDIYRPGSPHNDPRDALAILTNPNASYNEDDDNSSKSNTETNQLPEPPLASRGASPPKTDDRTIPTKLSSPLPRSSSIESIKDVASEEENRFPKAKPKNQTSSSDSTNARVASPPWNSKTNRQPNRSTPSPSNQNRGRRTSMGEKPSLNFNCFSFYDTFFIDQRVISSPSPPRPVSDNNIRLFIL